MSVKNSETDMYADDSSISNEAKTLPGLNKNLTEDMANAPLWCKQNGMAANTTRTKARLITTRQKRPTLDDQLQVVMDGQLLANVESDKLLGVMINKKSLMGRTYVQNCLNCKQETCIIEAN